MKKLLTYTLTLLCIYTLAVPHALAVMYTPEWYALINRPTPNLPDMMVDAVYLDQDSRLTIRQRNIGTADVTPVYGMETHVYVDGVLRYKYDWARLEDRSFMKAGGVSEFKLGPMTGSHMYEVCTDNNGRIGDGVVAEISEFNNCMRRWLDSGSKKPKERRTGYSKPTLYSPHGTVLLPPQLNW